MNRFDRLRRALVITVFGMVAPLPAGALSVAVERPRLAVLTDIGGDPDDRQSMIRLMLYAHEFEIEALIASASGTPGELKKEITQPQVIREILDAYGRVLPNLRRHADGWYRDPPRTDTFAPRTTVSRWRAEFQADFARRMAWCVVGESPYNSSRDR